MLVTAEDPVAHALVVLRGGMALQSRALIRRRTALESRATKELEHLVIRHVDVARVAGEGDPAERAAPSRTAGG